jgi:hypothetical protein
MEKDKLVEIKKDKTGTGLLIEHDGFMSLNESSNGQTLKEAIGEDGEFHCPNPFIVDAVFQKFGIKNANGRIYPERILKREVEKYMQKLRDKNAIGELNHPAESVIDLSRVATNIIELHWEGHTLVGKMEILVTPGFRKYGIVSTCADETANLLLHGIKIGVSSRGVGTVSQEGGVLVVCDDFELVCWDVVSDPSTPNAWISDKGSEDLQRYVEEKENNKPLLSEKIEKISQILSDF